MSMNAYQMVFTEYPDIVDLEAMQEMLGNISKKSARRLIKDKKIKAFKIGREYRIPKLNILVYLGMASPGVLESS